MDDPSPAAVRSTPVISLVVAMDRKGIIGRDGGLPWHLPKDLAHFKRLTVGKPIVMGRRTWAEIGRPLPHRVNIVLTRDPSFTAEGVLVAHDPEEALRLAAPAAEVMIIGGAEVYAVFLPIAHRIHVTRIEDDVLGDTRFPTYDPSAWRLVTEHEEPADDRNAHTMTFQTWERRLGGEP
jgi:dihydrofolate reductase